MKRQFSVLEAGFSGYRLLVAKPGVALWWLAFSLLVSVVSVVALVWLAGPQMVALREIQSAGPGAADPATVAELSRQMLPYQLFGTVFPWLVWAMSIGAVVRCMVGRGRPALGHLGFGADELRLLVNTLVVGVLIGLACLGVLIATVIALVGGGGAGGLRGGLGHVSPGILALAAAVALLGVAGIVFLGIKLSLSAAQTVTDRAVRIFSSWTITKGRFWPILGAYLLAVVPLVLAWIVSLVILVVPSLGAAEGRSFMQVMRTLQPDVSTLGAAFQPSYLLMYAVDAVMRTLTMAGLIAPTVSILQALRPDAPAEGLDDEDDEDED